MVERKGREKAVACRRVERTAIVVVVARESGEIWRARLQWEGNWVAGVGACACLLYVHFRDRCNCWTPLTT